MPNNQFDMSIFERPLSIEEYYQTIVYLSDHILDGTLKTANPEDKITFSITVNRFTTLVNGRGQSLGEFPASLTPLGGMAWMKAGKLHREGDKPACTTPDGSFSHLRNGLYHRDNNLPSLVDISRELVAFYRNGKLHRSFGLPASVSLTGAKHWYEDGYLYMIHTPENGYSILNLEMATRILATADPTSPLQTVLKNNKD